MICEKIQNLINYAVQNKLIRTDDEFVIRNQLMNTLNLTEWIQPQGTNDALSIDEILNSLVEYACKNKIIDDTTASHDLFDTKLMGCLTMLPHEVIDIFHKKYADSPQTACDWYYNYNQKLNYVRASRIAKELKWQYLSEFGLLDITINLSKPEKDPRDIAKAQVQTSAYPKCQLCPENAGFAGNLNHPARQNLRPIPLCINGEKWQFQYSPYGYYNEHCIIFNESHQPMKIDSCIFEKLFDVLDIFPHYFVGSNADLPIVGGSILSHEHFQGGNYSFPMNYAETEYTFSLAEFPNVQAATIKWPLSVIRLKSTSRLELSNFCTLVTKCWKEYSDSSVGIWCKTDNTLHNTITPIARKNADYYECDLVLRNNITSNECPLGVFHPNPSLHHIKKENIGLIEVMGLAILPSRLSKELAKLKEVLINGDNPEIYPETIQHSEWAKDILKRNPDFSEKNAEKIIQDEVGAVFEKVLCDAGVFKRDLKGQAAFLRFIDYIESHS